MSQQQSTPSTSGQPSDFGQMGDAMELSPSFLEIAACPACHSKFAVDYDAHELVCSSRSCGLAYPVRDGIPVLLIDEARKPGETAASTPRV